MQFGVNKQEYIFFKDKKTARARREMQFVVWKTYKYLLQQIAGGITCYNVHEKNIAGGEDRRNFESVLALFVFCPGVTTLDLRYDFALVLHENAFVFSLSEAYNFFIYIINKVIYL